MSWRRLSSERGAVTGAQLTQPTAPAWVTG